MKFDLSCDYCEDHGLNPLNLNFMCVRVKESDRSGEDTDRSGEDTDRSGEDTDRSGEDIGYWVGHFQISGDVKKEGNNRKQLKSNVEEGDEYRSVVAQLIYSSTPIPESLITQRLCYVTAELILINLPNRLVKIISLR